MRAWFPWPGWALALCLVLAAGPASAQRQIAEEALLFQELKDGVFTVYSEYGQGSGFLVDASGLVGTNAHVLGTSERIRVIVDPGTKVEARRVLVNETEDLAVLRIHPSFCEGRPVLVLPGDLTDFVAQGERVFVIGSPLNRDRVLTTGVVSDLDGDLILTDANINPGNSGGPLLNLASEVVGVVSFNESGDSGPGLAGAVNSRLLDGVLAEARRVASDAEMPGPELYPSMPLDEFPLSALQNAALLPSWPEKMYSMDEVEMDLGGRGRSRFTNNGVMAVKRSAFAIEVLTPPYFFRAMKSRELEAARNRSSRSGDGDYEPVDGLRGWALQAGAYPPIVSIVVLPRITRDPGILTDNYAFQGDLSEFQLFVDDQPVEDLHRRLAWIPLDFEVKDGFRTAKASDVARAGNFAFDPAVFAPRPNGSWPKVTLRIQSAVEGSNALEFDLPRATLERIAIDFEPYQWAREARGEARHQSVRAGGR